MEKNEIAKDFIPDSEFISDKEKYGSGMQGAAGFAEQVGKGALGPLSTAAEIAVGVPKEDILEREKAASGLTKFTGQATGLIGSTMLPFVGQARILGAAGRAVTGALGAESVIAKIGSAAAASAVENAFYETGNQASQKLLNDPDQTTASAMMNIGAAGLLGGVLGGSLGAVHPIWEATVGRKAENFLKAFTDVTNREKLATLTEDVVKPSISKELFDPFEKKLITKEIVPEEQLLKTTKQVFDPFEKRFKEITIETPKPSSKDLLPEGEIQLPKKLEKLLEFIPAGVAGAASVLLGHNPVVGAAIGHAAKKLFGVKPEAMTTSLLKYMMSNSPINSSGLKATADFLNSAIKGQLRIQKAAQAIISPSRMAFPKMFIPDLRTRDRLDKNLQKLKVDQRPLLESGGKIGHYMPEHTSVLAQHTMSAINYIESKRPEENKKLPFDKQPKISQIKKSEFDRVLDIADQPLILMNSIKDATLTQSDVEHLKFMYPKIYEQMSDSLLMAVMEKGNDDSIPYKQRLSLSLFLGQPLDSTMTPENILANQMTTTGQMANQQPVNQPQKMSSSKASKLAQGVSTQGQAREASKGLVKA